MAENDFLTNIDKIIATIPALKKEFNTKLTETDEALDLLRKKKAELIAIEEEKARAEAEKAALLAAKKAEEEAKKQEKKAQKEEKKVEETPAPQEETVQEPVVETKEEPKEEPQVVEEQPKVEEKVEEVKIDPKSVVSVEEIVSEDGKTKTIIETLADGTKNTKRVFIVQPKQPKQQNTVPSTRTKVFASTPEEANKRGNQRPPRPTTGAPNKPTSGSKPGDKPINVPQNFPPQKQNTNANVKKKNAVEEKSTKSKRDLIKGHYITDTKHGFSYDEDEDDGFVRTKKIKKSSDGPQVKENKIQSCVISTEIVAIKTLSSKTGIAAAEIIKKLFMLGMMKTINDSIDIETAQLIADEFNITIEYKPEATTESTLSEIQENDDIEELDKLQPRPPIITIMGHVDHGKTSLLDYIRKSRVALGEAGGITQAIGAYTITLNGRTITFIDTPGHEAFTAMRARGSKVTDIAILVVAADDGIMPQTIESINHAKTAGVPIIVAINKIDKNGANPDRVLQQLTEYELIPEEWGGSTQVCKVSAKTGEGIQNLLENIILQADILELKANPDRSASGSVIESRLDKGKGPLATILVQKGTLKVGDYVVAGTCYGKIRGMVDDKGKAVKSAGPSIPVSVSGFTEVPVAGDTLIVVQNEKFAKDLITERKNKLNQNVQTSGATSLADIYAKVKAGELKSLKIILKADVQGSVEAVAASLSQLGNDEVRIEIIHKAVGNITENDINLAVTAGAIIIGFNLPLTAQMKSLAEKSKVDIRTYAIIYEAIDEVKKAVKGMLAPKFEEVTCGQAEVRALFNITGAGVIAGSYVISGLIKKGSYARLIRNKEVVVTTTIASLKHNKDDVKEIKEGWECGIQLQNFQEIQVGDIIESFTKEEIVD